MNLARPRGNLKSKERPALSVFSSFWNLFACGYYQKYPTGLQIDLSSSSFCLPPDRLPTSMGIPKMSHSLNSGHPLV